MASSLGRRLVSGMSAYAYAQVVTVVTQLLSLPLFLSIWDVATYGHWLIISAIPFYLSLADVGISTASGNRMISSFAKDQKEEANAVFQSAVAFLTMTSIAILCVVSVLLWMLPQGVVSVSGWKLTFLALSITVLLGLFCSLAETVYRATNGYATGTYLVTTGRLTEWLGGVIGLFVFGSFLGVAVAALVARLLYFGFMFWHSQKRTTHVRWGFREARLDVVKKTSVPGVLFFVISLTNALSFQGFTLLVAAMLGPVATAAFNAYRTIARVVVQVANSISSPLWPELSLLNGSGDHERFRHVYRRATSFGIAIALGGAVGVFLVSPYVLDAWAKGKIPYDPIAMGLFLAYAAVSASWQIPRVTLLSIDRHGGLAWKGIAAAAIALGVGAVLTRAMGISGAASAMILGEVLIWLASNREIRVVLRGSTAQ